MKILYGSKDKNIDVTDICYKKLMKENIIKIPRGDEVRARFFSDSNFGVVKYIFIIKKSNFSVMNYFFILLFHKLFYFVICLAKVA